MNAYDLEGITECSRRLKEITASLEMHNPMKAIAASFEVIKPETLDYFQNKAKANLSYLKNTQGLRDELLQIERSQIYAFSRLNDELIKGISASISTPMIEALNSSVAAFDYQGIAKSITSAFENTRITEAANIALLANSRQLTSLVASSFPRGLKTAIKNIDRQTAQVLSQSTSLQFDFNCLNFCIDGNQANNASIEAAKLLAHSLLLFDKFTDEDMVSFLNHCAMHPGLQLKHTVGRRLYEIVRNWSSFIDFQQDEYYHARKLDADTCPYSENEMCQTPRGMSGHGRFNNIGESHYYISDTREGAIAEIRNHARTGDYAIQVARVTPSKPIKMIDLSTNSPRNVFLDYCRYAPIHDDGTYIKREYLIPSFFATCCKDVGIEGIKYYGTKSYNNCVVWNDGYFKTKTFDFVNKDGSARAGIAL
jgi:hypothetical protein